MNRIFYLYLHELKKMLLKPSVVVSVVCFWLLSSLFLWMLNSSTNLTNQLEADIKSYFFTSAILLTILSCLLANLSLFEEKRYQTSVLQTFSPFSSSQYLGVKFALLKILLFISITPSFMHFYLLESISSDSLEIGVFLNQFLLLWLYILVISALALFLSASNKSFVVGLLLSLLCGFSLFYGFEFLGNQISNNRFSNFIASLGGFYIFEKGSLGILNLSHCLYFLGLIFFFLGLYHKKQYPFSSSNLWIYAGPVLVFLSFLFSNQLRFDLTENKRYTITDLELAQDLFEEEIEVMVYLEGNLPMVFQDLREETSIFLSQFQRQFSNLKIRFIDFEMLDENSTEFKLIGDLGLNPYQHLESDRGQQKRTLVFPWAVALHKNKKVKIPLLKNEVGLELENRIQKGIIELEYEIANAFDLLLNPSQKKIALIRDHGESDDALLFDLFESNALRYEALTFPMSKNELDDQEVISVLNEFDMVFVSNPTNPFSERDKFILDQYLMSGKSMIWLLQSQLMTMDSLFNEKGESLVTSIDLNLDDLFFKYGIRQNRDLVFDKYNTPVVFANGQGNQTQYNPLRWPYNPMVFPYKNHPITAGVKPLRFQFANSLDTLPNALSKTVLLQSSPFSLSLNTPLQLSINEVINQANTKEIEPSPKRAILGVLLEGQFESAFKNRVLPLKNVSFKAESSPAKLLLVSDGELGENQFDQGKIVPLGYDKWTNTNYGNKEFLSAAMDYVLGKSYLLKLKSKIKKLVVIQHENIKEVSHRFFYWSFLIPSILFTSIIALLYWVRRKKYASL